MMEHGESGEGFSVLDGAALVTGAAVASIHLRASIRSGLTGFGWILVWVTFALIALTSAGPFLYLARRYGRKVSEYPKIGDRIWGALGLPWLTAALLHSVGAWQHELASIILTVGLGMVCLIAVATLWSHWVSVSPEQADRAASGPWTNRVGIALMVAWPVQCGLALVVLG